MSWLSSQRIRKWLIVPPLVAGVVAVVLLRMNRRELASRPPAEFARTLRFIKVPVVDVVPRVIGYGTAKPRHVWRAVAEVEGRLIQIHPELESGAMLKKGELVLKIDPREYELAVAKLEADIRQVKAQLKELAVREANDRELLKLEERSLQLTENQLKRLQSLLERNSVSASQVDDQMRAVLAQRRSVQTIRNALKLYPLERHSLEALLAVKQASLERAQLDLAKTSIRCPFDCRVGDVVLQVGQFVRAGEVLFEAQGTDVTEVEAQVPLNQLRNLIDRNIKLSQPVTMSAESVRKLFNFDVIVRYRIGDFEAEWKARVDRMREHIEPQTHTIGLVVAVDKPYEKAIPGKRPPLVEGMFCEVEFRGKPRKQRAVIPRLALRSRNTVFVLDEQNRLRRRSVEVEFSQANFLCLRSGLKPNERLIVSDPAPAIEGMLVDPVEDRDLAQRIKAEATGQGDVK